MWNNKKRNIYAVCILAGLWLLFETWPLIVQNSPTEINLTDRFIGPSASRLFGTDALGRDVFTRAAYGARLSFRVSILAWLASLLLGLTLGGIAGYWENSWIDRIINWFIGALFILPYMIIIIAALSIMGPGLVNSYIVLTFIAWAAPARMTRVNVINIKTKDFVRTAQAMGYSPLSILCETILPSAIPPAIIASVAILPELVALDAGLAFFGLGVQPPTPSLGKMIADGLNSLSFAWWIAMFPTIILGIICININIITKILRKVS